MGLGSSVSHVFPALIGFPLALASLSAADAQCSEGGVILAIPESPSCAIYQNACDDVTSQSYEDGRTQQPSVDEVLQYICGRPDRGVSWGGSCRGGMSCGNFYGNFTPVDGDELPCEYPNLREAVPGDEYCECSGADYLFSMQGSSPSVLNLLDGYLLGALYDFGLVHDSALRVNATFSDNLCCRPAVELSPFANASVCANVWSVESGMCGGLETFSNTACGGMLADLGGDFSHRLNLLPYSPLHLQGWNQSDVAALESAGLGVECLHGWELGSSFACVQRSSGSYGVLISSSLNFSFIEHPQFNGTVFTYMRTSIRTEVGVSYNATFRFCASADTQLVAGVGEPGLWEDFAIRADRWSAKPSWSFLGAGCPSEVESPGSFSFVAFHSMTEIVFAFRELSPGTGINAEISSLVIVADDGEGLGLSCLVPSSSCQSVGVHVDSHVQYGNGSQIVIRGGQLSEYDAVRLVQDGVSCSAANSSGGISPLIVSADRLSAIFDVPSVLVSGIYTICYAFGLHNERRVSIKPPVRVGRLVVEGPENLVNGGSFGGDCFIDFYFDEDQSTCIPCKAGHSCTGTVVLNPCPAGFYCEEGESPVACPSGHRCPVGSSAPISCDRTKLCLAPLYSEPVSLFWFDYGMLPITETSTTELRLVDVTSRGVVVEGEAIALLSAETINYTLIASKSGVISDWKFSVNDLVPLFATIAHLTPTEGASVEKDCPEGFFCANPGQYALCPIGHFCPQGSYAPIPCSNGDICVGGGTDDPFDETIYYPALSGGSVTNDTCPEGFYCPTPSMLVSCHPGQWCPPGSIEPLICPAGNYCSENGTLGFCADGEYCPEGSFESRACPAGFSCRRADNNTLVRCPEGVGLYCPDLSWEAVACPAGFYCEHPGTKSVCPGGSYCPKNSTAPNSVHRIWHILPSHVD